MVSNLYLRLCSVNREVILDKWAALDLVLYIARSVSGELDEV